ncbi:hypothetical protein ACSNOJ_24995 [Streptomyces sp. URMC 128]|uniref:hypothetical protein n=1 Tax=Streptomyces sp. URMC 128 TaxID=3423404 RepID=UPI003F1A659B
MTVDDSLEQCASADSPTLVVSMSTFRLPAAPAGAAEDDDEDPPERSAWDDLPFSQKLGERVARHLAPLVPPAPRHLPDLDHATLGARMEELRAAIKDGGCAVVHIVSHGFLRRNSPDDLMVVATDTRDQQARTAFDVRRFLQEVDDEGTGRVLLLLDVCHGGAGIDWTRNLPRAERRLFVIAACPSDTLAWGGRFSRAMCDVLEDLAKGHTGVDPRQQYVRLSWLKDEVYRRLLSLCEDDACPDQEVVASDLDGPDIGFLANPWYREDPVEQLELRDRWALQEFIDTVHPSLDLGHYLSRASGRETATGLDVPCHFSGRDRELGELADWLARPEGEGAAVAVVTGSPGTGKSALLGVVVCCTHPTLSKALKTVVNHIAARNRPDPREAVAAVHARGMPLSRVIEAIAGQLDMTAPDDGWTVQGFVDAVAALPVEPLIVLDALDEATESVRITVELLHPLANREYPDGPRGRPCRLLVGVRPYGEWIRPLLEAAAEPGQLLLDLDDTDREDLREALAEYVEGLLKDTGTYPRRSPVRRAVAQAVARRVESAGRAAPAGGGGEFLTAQLAARSIGSQPPIDAEDVQAAVDRLPLTLAALLDGQLFAADGLPWARCVLTAIAFGKGEGMPMEIIRSAAAAFHPAGAEPGRAEVVEVLASMSFFLRRDIDPEYGTTLYRLYHQELVDHLAATAPVGGGPA